MVVGPKCEMALRIFAAILINLKHPIGSDLPRLECSAPRPLVRIGRSSSSKGPGTGARQGVVHPR